VGVFWVVGFTAVLVYKFIKT
jgi:hypothetical protein